MKKDDITRLAKLELLKLNSERQQYNSNPIVAQANINKLWGLYKSYLKTARVNPSFSLQKILKVFRYLCVCDPDLKKQVEYDYRELLSLNVENPFHWNPNK